MAFRDETEQPIGHQPTATRRWLNRAAWGGGAALVIGFAIVVRSYWGPESASAQAPSATPQAAPPRTPAAGQPTNGAPTGSAPAKSDTVAIINGQRITRQELGSECVRFHGEDVLESLVNKHLIVAHCEQRGIKVTREEVDREIARIAQNLKMNVNQLLSLYAERRDVTPEQYANEIVWPTLALRKLAAPQLEVTEPEIQQALEHEFGPAVRARIIVVSDAEKARTLLQQVRANPDDFGRLAGLESEDVNSAATGGRIQPIHMHSGDQAIEQVAFRLKENEISDVIPVGTQFVILKCEGQLPPAQVNVAEVREALIERIKEKKLPEIAQQLYRELQSKAVVENILNDKIKSQAMPGVAAKVNGYPITIRDLTEECITRHGKEVLKGMIDRRLVEQEIKRQNLVLTRADLDAEVVRAATVNRVVTESGEPDVQKWIELITQEGNIDTDTYYRDVVWPTAAMRKLVASKVQVTEEDLQKAFEANYGPRAICRAIVLNDMRQAKQVWSMARDNNTVENFAKLAEEFSIEPGGRTQGGQVPPIQRYGGQPLLEEEAFKLKSGDLSGIIQVGESYIILRSDGYTTPIQVDLNEVRNLLHEDILDKKLRLAMSREFDRLKQAAEIDDFIAGTSQSPPRQHRAVAAGFTAPAQSATTRPAAPTTR